MKKIFRVERIKILFQDKKRNINIINPKFKSNKRNMINI